MARGALVATGGLLIAIGGAAIGFAVTRKATGGMTPEATAAMTKALDALETDLKLAAAGIHERAATLAGLQQVQAAVVTDESTAKDMLVRGELAFQPQPGEVIELGQLPKGAKPVMLLVQPENAPHYPFALVPTAALMTGEAPHVVLSEHSRVMPKQGELEGYVMVSRRVELAPALERLTTSGVKGTIDAMAGKIDFGGSIPPNSGLQASRRELPVGMSVSMYTPGKPTGGMPLPIAIAGGATALLGLLLLVVGMMRKTDAATAGQPQLSTPPMASGTPSLPNVAAASISPNNLGPGAMVGRWEIVKRLGSGGMADVFLARAKGEAGFEKLVALKVMHPHLARNERAVQHFLDEARLAARVVHPNVVQIQDLGKIGNDYVIVMEFVEGVDLERLLASARVAQRAVPVNVGLGIMCRICDGLNAAHKATAPDGSPLNIVHRDVKSANVLVSKQGGVKVVDFGIAKAAKQSHLTIAGETKGTPSMMAPEQRVGEQVDVRADVYSAAAVAYEILTGHGVNLDLAQLAHLGIDNWPHLPPPTQLRPLLPPELDALLLGAMSYDREKRPADCTAFESSLEAIMKQHNLAASDKDIARWVTAEIEQLVPMGQEPAPLETHQR